MGQPSTEPAVLASSPQQWDGKCQNCRRLMSSCICFQEAESDADPLHSSATTHVTADASESRPLWNALRKMHRQSAVAQVALVQPPPSVSRSKYQHRKQSEALPPLSAPSGASSSSSRHHLHRRSDARPPTSSRRGSREPRREPSPEHPPSARKDRLQRAGFTSSYDLKREVVKEAGVMRSVRSTSSMDKHSRPKEKFCYEPERGSGPCDEDCDETVWEL